MIVDRERVVKVTKMTAEADHPIAIIRVANDFYPGVVFDLSVLSRPHGCYM